MLDRAAIAMRLKALVQERWPGHGGRRVAAQALGILDTRLSDILNGRLSVSRKNLTAFAKRLGIPPADLLLTSIEEHRTLPHRGKLSSASCKVDLLPESQAKVNGLADYPPGSFTVQVSGHGLDAHRLFDGDVLTIQLAPRGESGRFALIEVRNGFVLVGLQRGRYYLLKGAKLAGLPKSEIVRLVGIVIRRSSSIYFEPENARVKKA